jgi:two-component system chemotaxis response regulator CheY
MKKFLIVEDDRVSSKILENFLTNFADCDTAPNATVAFDLFEKSIIDGHPYDLICSDVVMPEVDGHELIRKIREREESLPIIDSIRTRIFMISTSDSPKDMTQAILDNGCDDYVVKPFHRDALKDILQKYDLIDQDKAAQRK